MSDQPIRKELIRLATSLPAGSQGRKALLDILRASGKGAAQQDWKVQFPSHDVRDELDKLYDRLSDYQKGVQRDRDPDLQNHKKLLDKALGSFVTLMAQVKRAEEALYY